MALHYNDSHWQDNQSLFITPIYNKIGNKIDPYSDLQAIVQVENSKDTRGFYKTLY